MTNDDFFINQKIDSILADLGIEDDQPSLPEKPKVNSSQKPLKTITEPLSNNTPHHLLLKEDNQHFMFVTVEEDFPIKKYVEWFLGRKYYPGKGYFEVKDKAKVSQKKEIILIDKVTKKFYTDPTFLSKVLFNNYVYSHPLFYVFVQSTSYNRKLKAGTKFLYKT